MTLRYYRALLYFGHLLQFAWVRQYFVDSHHEQFSADDPTAKNPGVQVRTLRWPGYRGSSTYNSVVELCPKPTEYASRAMTCGSVLHKPYAPQVSSFSKDWPEVVFQHVQIRKLVQCYWSLLFVYEPKRAKNSSLKETHPAHHFLFALVLALRVFSGVN